MDSSSSKKSRSKVTLACEYCRKRRIKCSGTKPKCENCYNLNRNCIYIPKMKKRGPKPGYIDEVVNSKVKKKIEELITDNLLSKKEILSLAKNNENLISNDILKKYISKGEYQEGVIQQNEMQIENSYNLKVLKENIKSRLLILKNKDFIIFKNSEKTKVGTAIIYNNSEIHKYHFIEIDNELINLYFRYAHFYIPVLEKNIFMQRIRNKAILPSLLLAVYSAAHFFKPNPDLKKARKYFKMAYNSIMDYNFGIDIQMVQTLVIISNCVPGTNAGWIIIGNALRFSYTLRINEENKSLKKIYNNEEKITFWYNICMDILYSIMTSRSYRYDYYNILSSEYAVSFLSQLELTKNSLIIIMNLVLSKLFLTIIIFIREMRSNNFEISNLDKKIDYWLKIFEPEFTFNYDIEDEDINSVITNSQFNIFFITLKIIFYRRKSILISTKHKEKLPDENDLNIYGDIGYNFIKFKEKEQQISDCLLNYCIDFLKKRNEIKTGNKKFTYYEDKSEINLLNENNIFENNVFKIKNDIQYIPEFFIYKNYLYIVTNKYKYAEIDFNLNDSYKNLEEEIQSSYIENSNDKKNSNHTYYQSNSNYDNEKDNFKQFKTLNTYLNMDENEKSESSNDKTQKFNDKLLNNIYNKLSDSFNYTNNDTYNINDKNMYDNQIYFNQNLNSLNSINYNINDINKDKAIFNFQDNELNLSQFFMMNNDNINVDNIVSNEDESQNNQFNEMENEHVNMNESSEIEDYFNCLIQENYDIIQKYIKFDKQNEMQSIQNDSKFLLKECYNLSKIVHEKIKKLHRYLNKQNMIMNFFTTYCLYEIGIIYILFYVDEGNKDDYQIAKYYENLLEEHLKHYSAITPYLKNYRGMLKEAEDSVQNNIKQLIIKDIF